VQDAAEAGEGLVWAFDQGEAKVSVSRRGFLTGLIAAPVVAALPEIPELWAPTKTIFLPPAGGWVRGNQLLTIDMITREALRILGQNLEFIATVNRQWSPAQLDAMRGSDRLVISMAQSYRGIHVPD
jgi:hypothetical protein